MKILVTGAGAVLGQGIIKSLRMAPIQYTIVAVDPDPRAVGLYWADQSYLVPLATDPSYLDVIGCILDRERPDAVLVGTDVELMTFAQHKSDLEMSYGTRVIVSPPSVIQIADDKWLTYHFLATHGFPHPKSSLPAGLPHFLRECDFPLIIKPRIGARSIGVQQVNDEKELYYALATVHNPVIQECVADSNHEYTSGLVVESGDVKAVVNMRRDLRDGNTYRAYVEPDAPFTPLLAKIAEQLGGDGPLNFQFRLDQGVPKIFEINARFSGTTPLRAHAGFNEVDHIVRHYVLGESIPEPIVRSISIFKYWSEIVVEREQLVQISQQQVLEPSQIEVSDLCHNGLNLGLTEGAFF